MVMALSGDEALCFKGIGICAHSEEVERPADNHHPLFYAGIKFKCISLKCGGVAWHHFSASNFR